ncbi:MAG: septum formation initiator family protein [bacterium]
MKEFQHDNERVGKRYSKWVILILLVLVVLVFRGLISLYYKKSSSEEEMRLVETKRAELQSRYNDLSGKVNDLNTNEGMEREIRSKFDVVKPGENVIMVVDKEIPAQAPQETSVIKKLWNGVVGVFKKKP